LLFDELLVVGKFMVFLPQKSCLRIMRLVQRALAIMAALGLRHGGKVNVDE